MTVPRLRNTGFTLVELLIALVLMAGMASILFGSLSLAARSWDGGEAKVLQVSDMRSAQTYLRAQIAAQYPQRLWKAAELPLLFAGERDEMRYAAVLPERVAEGGVYHFRLAVVRSGEKSLKAGALAKDVFDATEKPIRDAGLAENFKHHAGHGIGLAHPEPPILVPHSDDVLVAGDVVTLEPGLYVDGIGGIRIEHNYLITKDGYERLSHHYIGLTQQATPMTAF